MPRICISDETMRTLRREAIYEFHQTGLRQSDGTWLVDLGDEVAARLAAFALPGESADDTIPAGDSPLPGRSAQLTEPLAPTAVPRGGGPSVP